MACVLRLLASLALRMRAVGELHQRFATDAVRDFGIASRAALGTIRLPPAFFWKECSRCPT
jgi:hypothetical protein